MQSLLQESLGGNALTTMMARSQVRPSLQALKKHSNCFLFVKQTCSNNLLTRLQAALSPSKTNADESLSTLNYAKPPQQRLKSRSVWFYGTRSVDVPSPFLRISLGDFEEKTKQWKEDLFGFLKETGSQVRARRAKTIKVWVAKGNRFAQRRFALEILRFNS